MSVRTMCRTMLIGGICNVGCAIVFFAPLSFAAEQTMRSFRKITLTDKFYSEGAHFGDFNHDGKPDVAAGPFWYEGPDFQAAHEYRPVKAFDPHGYSDAFLMFTADLNGDEWDDILVAGWPGKEAFWFENPRGKDGHWPRHLAFDVVDNESPGFADITGDGRPELIFHTRGRLGYAEPNWDQPQQPWRFTPATAPGKWSRYQHGLGYGDINGDGRADLLMREGWWRQSDSAGSDTVWKFQATEFSNGRGGAQMLVDDVDGDGDSDVITSLDAHGYGVVWFEQRTAADGTTTFAQHTIVGSKEEDNPHGVKFSQPHALFSCDMDGDGLRDFVTGKRYWAHGPKGDAEPDAPAVLYWFRLTRNPDDGSVAFIPHLIDDDSGVGTQVAAGDVSGDGLPDVIVGNKKGAFVFLQK